MSRKSHRFAWSREITLDLIELYQKEPVLYDTEHADYKNKVRRHWALEKIINKLMVKNEYAATQRLTVDDITKKIHVLRTQFTRELKILIDEENSNVPDDEKYVPKLWAFNKLLFLKRFRQVRVSPPQEEESNNSEQASLHHECKVEPISDVDSDLENDAYEIDEEYNNVVSTPSPKRNKMQNEESDYKDGSASQSSESSLSQKDDTEMFVEAMLQEMKKLKNKKNIRKLKLSIFQQILKAQSEEDSD